MNTKIEYIDEEIEKFYDDQDLDGDYQDDLQDFDGDLVEVVNKKYPDWLLIRLSFFGYNRDDIMNWLEDPINDIKDYHIVGWSSGCSTSHGVVFKRKIDAMMFKLRWC